MTVSSGLVKVTKDANNLIGISIGGGAPLCPCLYIVQVFDNTPAAKAGDIESGDELTGVNRISVKGKTKTEVARLIQASEGDVALQYNKLHADPKQGKSLDIIIKKVKHKMVEKMSAETADALGLSRAILCNDSLLKRMEELERNSEMYKSLISHVKNLLRAYYNLSKTQRLFGDIFSEIGAREPQQNASEALTVLGECHRNLERQGIKLIRVVHPMISDLSTYLNKAIPDTKLTIKKYLDVKFEYLSYCLKLKELDDEEVQFAALHEPLYRVETGNYEYRLVLRCRQDARLRFAKLRSDVLVKLELLDQKHVQDIAFQLQRFVSAMARYHLESKKSLDPTKNLFPIEVDLSQVAVKYNTTGQLPPDNDDDNDDYYNSRGVREFHDEEEQYTHSTPHSSDMIEEAQDSLLELSLTEGVAESDAFPAPSTNNDNNNYDDNNAGTSTNNDPFGSFMGADAGNDIFSPQHQSSAAAVPNSSFVDPFGSSNPPMIPPPPPSASASSLNGGQRASTANNPPSASSNSNDVDLLSGF